MAVVACEQENQDLGTPSISLDSKEISFDIAGGDKTVAVTSSRDWTVECEEEWVAVNPEKGGASTEAQTITISALANDGKDREAKVKFICGGGLANVVLTVKQAGPGGTSEAIYFNDFDKELATEGTKGWPYLDQFEGWKNATGTGIANVEYAYSGVSARANGNSEKYYDYEGSGQNNLFFGKTPYFAIKNIALGGKTDLVLTFGTEKYSKENGSVFKTSEFHVWLSIDGTKWVDFAGDYSFAGGETEGRWNIAEAKFSVPAGTETLHICLQSDVASSYRVDDLKLDSALSAGTVVDFTAAVDKDFNAGGSTGGNEGGTDAPAAEYTIPQIPDLASGTKVIVKGHIVGRYKNGFMMSDGTNNLLVYENDKPSAHPVGTNVTVTAEKSTYSEQAQLKNVVSIETDGTVEVTYPEPMVVTAANIADLAAIKVPTYVSYTGVLKSSDGYYNIEIEGSETVSGSVSYPDAAMVEKITPWINGTVAVKGYYIGLTNGKAVAATMVIEISLVGDAPEPPVAPETEGEGTKESPYTPADAIAMVNAGAHTAAEVYVAGTISSDPDINLEYKNAGYYISADGTETDQFQIFRGKYLGGADFTAVDQIKKGDVVVVLGKLDAYQGTPQMAAGSKIMVLNGEEAPATPPTEDPEPGDTPVVDPVVDGVLTIDVNTAGTVFGKALGAGAYGDYKDVEITNTYAEIGWKASNITANQASWKDLGLAAAQFIQMKSAAGYIANTTPIAIKSLKVYVLPENNGLSVKLGTSANPADEATLTPSTESVTLQVGTSKTDVTDGEKELNVYTVDVSSNPTYFTISATANLWIYKIEIGY